MLFSEAELLLGEPSGTSIYDFEDNAHAYLSALMRDLRNSPELEVATFQPPWVRFHQDRSPCELDAEQPVSLPLPKVSGRQVLLIEPHCDDVALSVVGTLLKWRRPLTVVTLFNFSRTVDNRLPISQQLTNSKISELRRAENECALGVGMGARCLFLDEWEEPWPWGQPDDSRVNGLAERVAEIVDLTDMEIVAPFAFSSHPDHYLARRVAEVLGCNLFWEDIGFYREYARSIEDREYGWARWRGNYDEVVNSIDGYALHKMAILTTYQSQLYPPVRMMSVLRYHWAVARQSERRCKEYRSSTFAERLYSRSQF